MIKKIAVDLDGVLLDNSFFKQRQFRNCGLFLERWQLNSNVIDSYVSNVELRRKIDTLSAQSLHGRLVGDPRSTLLSLKRMGIKLYVISARGKSIEGKVAARHDMQELGILNEFDEIYLLSSSSEKTKLLVELGIDLYIDDRLDVLLSAKEQGLKVVLFDEFELIKKRILKTNLIVIKDIKELLQYVQA
jgi:phosphoglycolate phosphatase-like HAD superfamily hydrolase